MWRTRTIAITLLIVGFLWLSWDSLSFLTATPQPLLVRYVIEPMDPSKDTLYRRAVDAIRELDSRFAFLLPSCIIITGVLLLIYAWRHAVPSNDSTTI